jgi:phosphate transport system permease protein
MSRTEDIFDARLRGRHRLGRAFHAACFLSTWFGLVVLLVLLICIFWQGAGWVNWDFLTSFDSRHPEKAGILAGIWGTVWLIFFTALFSIPMGVGAAIYLEEYATDNWLTRLIQVNLSNLAGVPSIVYGILGLTVFVRMFGMFDGQKDLVLRIPLLVMTLDIPLPFGRTVLSGALTLSLLILPVVIVASREALRAVPASIRHGSYALGATQWQTIRHQVLPASLPGMMTGVILAISRAIGETAPLVIIGALSYVAFTPGDIAGPADVLRDPQGVARAPFDYFTTITIMIYNWVSRPKTEYQHAAAAGILVLLFVLLILNAAAIVIRHRYQKWIRW